jgi:hypothetical protein
MHAPNNKPRQPAVRNMFLNGFSSRMQSCSRCAEAQHPEPTAPDAAAKDALRRQALAADRATRCSAHLLCLQTQPWQLHPLPCALTAWIYKSQPVQEWAGVNPGAGRFRNAKYCTCPDPCPPALCLFVAPNLPFMLAWRHVPFSQRACGDAHRAPLSNLPCPLTEAPLKRLGLPATRMNFCGVLKTPTSAAGIPQQLSSTRSV